MGIFERTKMEEAQSLAFIAKADSVYKELLPYSNSIDILELDAIKNNFIAKTEDFFREDRKLNIGIIGRVKSGKSSFLNTFLFDGKEVLPKAVVPKTAVLTKIEYGEQNCFDIEYLPYDVKKGEEHKSFDTIEEMMRELNDYIGEDGIYTSSVQSVVVHINNEEIRGISIVDTPGFCDPNRERIEKTKDFLELCDVVFFLSKSTGFLDKGDVELMASQLPLKGVKRLILLCSRMDDGLRDVIWSSRNYHKASEDIKEKLNIHAEKVFEDYWNQSYAPRDEIKEICKKPIYISSMACNMSKKSVEQYTEQEKSVYEDLNYFGDFTQEDLKELGNFDEVTTIFNQVVREKDETLHEKAMSFVPLAKEELRVKLIKLEQNLEKRIEELINVDQAKLQERLRDLSTQVNGLNGDLEIIFGDLYQKVNQNKSDTIREFMGYSRECSQITEKEGLETHYQVNNVANSKWFMPWTWGESSREVNSYDEKYAYIDMSDVLDNIRNQAHHAKRDIEDSLRNVVDKVALKNQLLKAVLENFDTSDVNFDTSYVKLVVEKSIAQIETPGFSFDINNTLKRITQNYQGEIRSIAKMNELKSYLVRVSNDMFNDMGVEFEAVATLFKEDMAKIKAEYSVQLLNNKNAEITSIRQKIEEKEKEIQGYNEVIKVIQRIDVE